MYKHRPTTPDWLYYPANIAPHIVPEISKELLVLYEYTSADTIDTTYSDYVTGPYSHENKTFYKKMCPTLMATLELLNIQDCFSGILFIGKTPTQKTEVHVDGCHDIALTIPVLNCDASYTTWYDSEPIGRPPFFQHQQQRWAVANDDPGVGQCCHTDTMKEINRCPSHIPHWINVNVPHGIITTHNQTRINSSLRFDEKKLLANKNLPQKVYIG